MRKWLFLLFSVILLLTFNVTSDAINHTWSYEKQMSWYNPASWFQSAPKPRPQPSGSSGVPTTVSNGVTLPAQINSSPQYTSPNSFISAPFTATAPTSGTSLGGTGSGQGSASAGPSGGSSGGAAAAPAPAPNTNANGGSTSFLQGSFLPAVSQLQNTYNNLFGSSGVFPTAEGQAAGNVQQGYNTQLGNLGQSFAQAQTQLPWEYAGRGAANSGWANNAYNTAQNEFNNSQQGIKAAESKDIANIYQQGAGVQSQYGTYLDPNNPAGFNNPQFQAMLGQAPAYIQAEQLGNLGSDIGNLAYTQGANTPISQALAGISNNPSYQQTGSTALQAQLQALSGSGAPSAVQNQIAQGIIGNPSNPTNTNFLNYWQQLQGSPQNPQISTV